MAEELLFLPLFPLDSLFRAGVFNRRARSVAPSLHLLPPCVNRGSILFSTLVPLFLCAIRSLLCLPFAVNLGDGCVMSPSPFLFVPGQGVRTRRRSVSPTLSPFCEGSSSLSFPSDTDRDADSLSDVIREGSSTRVLPCYVSLRGSRDRASSFTAQRLQSFPLPS